MSNGLAINGHGLVSNWTRPADSAIPRAAQRAMSMGLIRVGRCYDGTRCGTPWEFTDAYFLADGVTADAFRSAMTTV